MYGLIVKGGGKFGLIFILQLDNNKDKSLGDIVSDIIDDVIDSPNKQNILKHHIISKDLTKQ